MSRVDASKPDYDFNDFTTIKKCKPTVRGMTDMLELLELELEGRHHSGIDDCKNLTRVVQKLMQEGYKFTQGMVFVKN